MSQTPNCQPDLAAEFWQYLNHKAGLKPPLAAKSWRAIRHSPEVHTWRYVLAQALRPDLWPPPDPLRRGPCRPGAIVAALEWAVRQRRLSRRDASEIEEKFLLLVNAEGVWR